MSGVRGPIPLEDANDLAAWAEFGRVPPRAKWVDEFVEAAEAAMIEAAF